MRRLTQIRTIAIVLLAAVIAQAHFDSIIKEYRGIFIGTDRDQVHQKLGKPKNEYSGEDDFDVSETESVRVFFDDAKKVNISR